MDEVPNFSMCRASKVVKLWDGVLRFPTHGTQYGQSWWRHLALLTTLANKGMHELPIKGPKASEQQW